MNSLVESLAPAKLTIDLTPFMPWLPVLAAIAAAILLVVWLTDNMDFMPALGIWAGIVLAAALIMWAIDYSDDNNLVDIKTDDDAAQVVTREDDDPAPTRAATTEDDDPVDLDASTADGQYPQCHEIQSAADAARILGGNAANWTVPDWASESSQGAFVFRSRSRTALEHPGFGFFDTPSGRFIENDVTAQEASFHCEEPPAS